MKTQRDHLYQNDGFTLLELLIALVVLAFGLMGVAGMVLTSVRGNAYSAQMTKATSLAQEKIEQLRTGTSTNLNANCSKAGCTGPPATPANLDLVWGAPNDNGTNGDNLTGGANDGIWTWKYTNPVGCPTVSGCLPPGMTLVWGVRRNYPQPGMIWLLALAQWTDAKQTAGTPGTKPRKVCTSTPLVTTDPLNVHSVCVESIF